MLVNVLMCLDFRGRLSKPDEPCQGYPAKLEEKMAKKGNGIKSLSDAEQKRLHRSNIRKAEVGTTNLTPALLKTLQHWSAEAQYQLPSYFRIAPILKIMGEKLFSHRTLRGIVFFVTMMFYSILGIETTLFLPR